MRSRTYSCNRVSHYLFLQCVKKKNSMWCPHRPFYRCKSVIVVPSLRPKKINPKSTGSFWNRHLRKSLREILKCSSYHYRRRRPRPYRFFSWKEAHDSKLTEEEKEPTPVGVRSLLHESDYSSNTNRCRSASRWSRQLPSDSSLYSITTQLKSPVKYYQRLPLCPRSPLNCTPL